MGRFIFFFPLLLLAFLATGQDIIHKKNGEQIRVRITDVNPGVIKYKNYDDQRGPVYSLAREQVDRIVYEDGQVTYFRSEVPERRIEKESPPQPGLRPSSNFGWHIGFGMSTIKGEYVRDKWQMASTIGASYNLGIGPSGSILFGAEITSLGCGLEDDEYIDHKDSAHYSFTSWNQDMGYIGLEILYRQYFNAGRNYFINAGMYGSFLMNAVWQGDVTITDTNGIVTNTSFQEELMDFYRVFDYGLTGGIGGRIPLGKSQKWHITLEARFYYGLHNIFDYKSLNIPEVRESNLFGFLLLGVDLPTGSSDQ